MNKTFIIIPCYNESGSICQLLEELKSINSDYNLVVINDYSTDQTKERVECISTKAILLDLPINLGVGGAVQTGLIFAKENAADFAVKVDGDGQHDPKFISELIKPLINNEADMVIGSRFLTENQGFKSTFFRRLGIKLLQLFTKLLTGLNISDPTSGYRAYNTKALSYMAQNYPSFDYPEPEEIVLASQNDLRIKEVPTIMRERTAGKSSISFQGSFYYMIKVMLSMLFIKIR